MTSIYEINTIAWLYRLAKKYQRRVTLASIPDDELNVLTSHNISTVWLMGVWQRSPLAVEETKHNSGLMDSFRTAIPDFTEDDVTGSPYAVKSYTVDQRFGGRDALAIFRAQLARHNMTLLLDYVPNHTALDHEWTITHPEYYITSPTPRDEFYQNNNCYIAYGKDPYFAPWHDTAQLNPFSQDYRRATIDTLKDIATMCDGVRCDMAMLLLNETVERTWYSVINTTSASEYWQDVIAAIKKVCPQFIMIAECYWNTEATLLNLGFDYCYDKSLYDYLRDGKFDEAELLVNQRQSQNDHLIHFLENHDEDRAAHAFSPDNERRSAAYIKSIPGVCLWHNGQFDGNTIQIPIRLRRGVDEEASIEWQQFYLSLLQHSSQL